MKILIAALFLLLSSGVVAQNYGQKDHPMNKTTPNVDILKYWGKTSIEDIEIYKAAEKIFAASQEASYDDLFRSKEFVNLCRKNNRVLLGGPMLGNVSAEGISIWLRTSEPSSVAVKVVGEKLNSTFGPFYTKVEDELSVVIDIDGLQSSTTYTYQIFVNDKLIDLPAKGKFTTTTEFNSATKTRITFGSCPHRWGLGNEQLFQQIESRDPIAMLLLGDIAVQDRNNHFGKHRADYLARDLQPAWKNFVSSVPVYASWDDHDYFDNDKAGIPEGFTKADKQEVRLVFKNSWANPFYGLEDKSEGIFTRTRIGPADIIMTDNRYFRKNKPGSFLGDEQMNWLKEQLLDCQGPFIILSCGSMWSDYVSNGKDSWGMNDPEGREEIFKLIEDNNIGGVLLISGDRHGARGFTIPREHGFSLYEFEAGSLGARVGPPATKTEWTTQLYGIDGRFAFGEFTFDTTKSDPTVTFKLIEENGEIIYEHTMNRSTLTPNNFK